jgi:hypothetical protein
MNVPSRCCSTPVQPAFGAVRHVEVLPAVAIEIGDRNRGTHRRHLRLDGIKARVEGRGGVGKSTPIRFATSSTAKPYRASASD